MIKVRLKEVARKHGIKNGYQFQKFTGYSTSMANNLWKKEWKFASLKTLNNLCNLLECTPNDLLEFKPDPEEK